MAAIRRDITLTTWHDQQICARMTQQGIGRSEAVRQFISESTASAGRGKLALARTEIRQRVHAIKLHCLEARARPSRAEQHLAQIDHEGDEINRLAADAMG